MKDRDGMFELSVGGPAGIHIVGRAPPVIRTPTPFALPGRRWWIDHGTLLISVAAALGCVVWALAFTIIELLALPRLLYLPAALASAALWAAAFAVHVIRRRGRRALAAAIERDILGHAARIRGPLTVPDTALALGLPLADVDAALADLARAGHAVADIDLDTGHLHYRISTRHDLARQDPRP